jgi:hypothetical protein
MEITQVYNKAIRVVDSCENETQLSGAINYCNLFKDQFIKKGHDSMLVQIYHNELLKLIDQRINENYRDNY